MIFRIIAVLGAALVALCAVFFWCYSEVVISVPVTEKVVALTYDDGPNPTHTQTLLDTLAHHRVTATFFLKGRNVEAFPYSVHLIASEGHEIGNHSYGHRPMFSLSKSDMLEEVVRTNELIENLLGYQPVLFRPPYGAQGPGLKLALEELDMPSILASADGADWELTDPQQIAATVLKNIEPGSIILLHDGHGDVDDPDSQDGRAATVAATDIVIAALKTQGYRFVTVGELMAMSDQ